MVLYSLMNIGVAYAEKGNKMYFERGLSWEKQLYWSIRLYSTRYHY